MNITAKIQELRQQKRWSVARLAREAGIPTVSLRAMLARKDPNAYNVKNLIKIAKALGVSVSYLTQSDSEDAKPKITVKQKEELMKQIEQVIDNFFKIEGDTDES
jgi:transcriptional regulator with XRE-family HTH domain